MMAQWFDPDALAEQQRKMRQEPASSLTGGGDFGSYALANRGGGLAGSGIEGHNLVHARGRVGQYAALLGGRTFTRIADLGCGLGLTTGALAEHFPEAAVTGFEVSADAVEFAGKTFPRCRFVEMAIRPGVPLGDSFDLILCQEFYPFTRTSDGDTHRAYVRHCLDHLVPGGVLLIQLSERDREKSILMSLDAIGHAYTLKAMPFDKIFRMMPLFTPALLASMLASRLLSAPRNFCIIMRR